jgi:hypothetical protein
MPALRWQCRGSSGQSDWPSFFTVGVEALDVIDDELLQRHVAQQLLV